jgi:pyruvate formate lyase activating enzyme
VKIDELYFLATGGGVCFGGGEPSLRYEFIQEFRDICGPDWKLTIETALNVPKKNIETLISVIDYWIVDVKDMNPEIYKAYTGKENKQVLENLELLRGISDKVMIRIPSIPEYNTKEDQDRSVAKLKEMGFSDFDLFGYRTEINKG